MNQGQPLASPDFDRSGTRRLGPIAAALALACALPPAAQAQDYGGVSDETLEAGPQLLELASTVEALGLGGAHMGSGAHAIFSHPALVDGGGASSLVQRFGSGATRVTASGGTSWFGGGVAIGLALLEHGAPGADPAQLLSDEAALSVPGPTGAVDFVLAAGFSRSVMGLEAGLSAKLVGQRLGGGRATTGALDLGVAKGFGPATVALSVQNLGPALESDGVSPVQDLPLAKRVALGAFSRRYPVGPLDIGGAAQLARTGQGAIEVGGGLEIAWWPVAGRTFVGRIGGRHTGDGTASPVTFGAGFAGDRIRLDYAFQGYDSVEGAHSFGLAFR